MTTISTDTKPAPRVEDDALVRGTGRFMDDPRLPNSAYAAFVRSTHAHARVVSVKSEEARKAKRVLAVLTADDMPPRIATGQIPMLVPNPAIRTPRTQIALARDEVCYVGQTVAVVVADNRYLAEDAANAVEVAAGSVALVRRG